MSQQKQGCGSNEVETNPLIQVGIVFLAALLVSATLQLFTLNSFFIFDDVSMFKHASPQFGVSFTGCFHAMSNGFWRPLNRVAFHILDITTGKTPFFYHLMALLIHSAVCAATFCASKVFFQFNIRTSILAALLTTVSVGGFSARIELSSTCDSLVVLFLLLSLVFWRVWQVTGRRKYLFFVILSVLFGIMSKETSAVLPVLLLLSVLVRGRLEKHERPILACLFATSIIHGIVTLAYQHNSASYTNEGRISSNPLAFARQFLDYFSCLIVPYLHVLQWPFRHLEFSHSALWAIRIILGIAVGAGVIVFFIRKTTRIFILPFLMSGLVLFPVSIITDAPQSRFLYPAIPFFSIGIAALFHQAYVRYAVGKWMLFSGWIILNILGFYFLPTMREYVTTCAQVRTFVEESRRVSASWEDSETITVYNHPHPGLEGQRWGYCQQLFDVFLPSKHAILALDHFAPETSHAYNFLNGKLVPVVRDDATVLSRQCRWTGVTDGMS